LSRAQVEVILADHDQASRRLFQSIEGLTEAEYRWEPVPGALTLKNLWPQPESGISTIEWKLPHVAAWKMRYASFLFGDGSHTFHEILACGRMEETVAYLTRAVETMRAGIEGLSDHMLKEVRPTGWSGTRARAPLLPSLNWMIQHDVYHAGQIRTLRGLYRASRPIQS
jgi:uncharacterized damage-inducible protein DinB